MINHDHDHDQCIDSMITDDDVTLPFRKYQLQISQVFKPKYQYISQLVSLPLTINIYACK